MNLPRRVNYYAEVWKSGKRRPPVDFQCDKRRQGFVKKKNVASKRAQWEEKEDGVSVISVSVINKPCKIRDNTWRTKCSEGGESMFGGIKENLNKKVKHNTESKTITYTTTREGKTT